MPSEAQTWSDHVRPVLYAANLDPHRVENAVALGMPDVNYRDGWIELKYAPEWPKRGGPLRIPHYTPQQRVWLLRRWRARGNAFLLLRVNGSEFFLFDGVTAQDVGELTREQLITRAQAYSNDGFEFPIFVPVLTALR